MAKQKGQSAGLFLCLWVVAAAAAAQNLVVPAVGEASFEDQKNYYTPIPDPHIGTPPPAPRVTPPHRTSPPHRHGGTPPTVNCGNPPHVPTPSTPRGGGGGGSYYNPPPSTPRGGGGGSYSSPPPSTPTPVIVSPPTTPIIIPGTPGAPTIPTPPFDPNSNPFTGTCNFWRNHPAVIWGLLGWWGTMGSTFGVTSMPGLPSNLNLMQALSNTRHDGLGQLYREGTASFLNSMVNSRFPYTTQQVRESFTAALGSNSAAAAQARLFRLANEGHTKPRD
ncbi:protodermal factor 1 isoform X2 [Rhodamnia argentea]|uniref:Protodermal factor 1 isoform X2 n=1 Tax=Rhodamnia argentea TaxID=178133 RepID=A0A8B8PWW9_9MYRT|nr:protodermal factor 1 isoform X2 [Rhodamnia argentea]